MMESIKQNKLRMKGGKVLVKVQLNNLQIYIHPCVPLSFCQKIKSFILS